MSETKTEKYLTIVKPIPESVFPTLFNNYIIDLNLQCYMPLLSKPVQDLIIGLCNIAEKQGKLKEINAYVRDKLFFDSFDSFEAKNKVVSKDPSPLFDEEKILLDIETKMTELCTSPIQLEFFETINTFSTDDSSFLKKELSQYIDQKNAEKIVNVSKNTAVQIISSLKLLKSSGAYEEYDKFLYFLTSEFNSDKFEVTESLIADFWKKYASYAMKKLNPTTFEPGFETWFPYLNKSVITDDKHVLELIRNLEKNILDKRDFLNPSVLKLNNSETEISSIIMSLERGGKLKYTDTCDVKGLIMCSIAANNNVVQSHIKDLISLLSYESVSDDIQNRAFKVLLSYIFGSSNNFHKSIFFHNTEPPDVIVGVASLIVTNVFECRDKEEKYKITCSLLQGLMSSFLTSKEQKICIQDALDYLSFANNKTKQKWVIPSFVLKELKNIANETLDVVTNNKKELSSKEENYSSATEDEEIPECEKEWSYC